MQHIIWLTLKEIVNKRMVHIGVILSVIFLSVYGIGLYYMVKDRIMFADQFWYIQTMGYQLLTFGWYLSTLISGALAIFAGAGSISGEIESGTMLALASRPLKRSSIIAGKIFYLFSGNCIIQCFDGYNNIFIILAFFSFDY